MDNMDLHMGEFVVWNECTYRVQTYSNTNEYELYDAGDIHCVKPIQRISIKNVSDSFSRVAFCQYRGVEYPAFYIEDDKCYYKRNINYSDDNMCCVSIYDMDEIWIRINRRNESIKDTIYVNPEYKNNKPSHKKYSVEEMANGNNMTSHLEEMKDLNQTIQDLEKIYRDRIKFQTPVMEMLIMDYYICTFFIDGISFCLDCDYGIITISVDNEEGNPYIFEMVDYFNRSDGLFEGSK